MNEDNGTDPVLEMPSNYIEEEELQQLKDSEDVEKLRSVLKAGEQVYRIVLCINDGREAVLAATNKRIIFCDKRFIFSDVLTFQYKEIAAIVSRKELLTIRLALVHADGALSVEGVDKDQGKRFIDYVGNYIGQDYEIQGRNGRSFEHVGEMISLEDLPSQDSTEPQPAS